ncbi:hypothetical protein KSD_29650 [Ktedonobacter sp. SOSP1-85]|uniref:hypothetical protein n=1 Tax=Ktedonobacter sp. SOSP1-85 TaxID=2778367 RepID=UPI0019157B2A|nr:hypothetical protein [Ktedonobacter sp. SOSP1-85]GHO75194.1 hypothetical protein KSD_29650 [Ktedonobacter sp. SOSP1-85]
MALARALVLQPQLLLLDEPLSALDVQTRREVRQELRRILTEAGITTVFVTHQYVDALVFGQHILVLDQGQVLQQGSQLDLAQQPRSAYVAELVGMNFLRGRLLRTEDDGSCVVRIAQSQPALDLTVMFEERQGVPPSGSEIYVVVEPRDITLHPAPPRVRRAIVARGVLCNCSICSRLLRGASVSVWPSTVWRPRPSL